MPYFPKSKFINEPISCDLLMKLATLVKDFNSDTIEIPQDTLYCFLLKGLQYTFQVRTINFKIKFSGNSLIALLILYNLLHHDKVSTQSFTVKVVGDSGSDADDAASGSAAVAAVAAVVAVIASSVTSGPDSVVVFCCGGPSSSSSKEEENSPD